MSIKQMAVRAVVNTTSMDTKTKAHIVYQLLTMNKE